MHRVTYSYAAICALTFLCRHTFVCVFLAQVIKNTCKTYKKTSAMCFAKYFNRGISVVSPVKINNPLLASQVRQFRVI